MDIEQRWDRRPVGSRDGLLVRFRTLALLALAMAGLAFAREAVAQGTLCIPQPGWVAGFSGSPSWWDGKDQNGNAIPSYDFTDPQWDPRWIGARGDDYGGGTTTDARFLAEYNVENGVTYL